MAEQKPDTDEEAVERRLRVEKIRKKVARWNERDFQRAVDRERSKRTDAQIRAQYAEAMREKSKGQG